MTNAAQPEAPEHVGVWLVPAVLSVITYVVFVALAAVFMGQIVADSAGVNAFVAAGGTGIFLAGLLGYLLRLLGARDGRGMRDRFRHRGLLLVASWLVSGVLPFASDGSVAGYVLFGAILVAAGFFGAAGALPSRGRTGYWVAFVLVASFILVATFFSPYLAYARTEASFIAPGVGFGTTGTFLYALKKLLGLRAHGPRL